MEQANGEIRELEETQTEKDLGVYLFNSLKPSLHCSKTASKAMSALKPLKMTFGCLTVQNFKILFSVYVRVS